MRRVVCAGVLTVLLTAPAAAQEPSARAYLPDRSDENWSFLKDAPRSDFWDPLKYVALPRDDWFITISGEVRYRPEGLRIRATPARPATIDNYLLQRYLVGADVRAGTHARVFTELQSGVIIGSLRSPRPTDRNTLDLHQAFFEWRHALRSTRRLTARIGRQELSIGSSRLISASPALNVKRSFDGGQVLYRTSGWALAAAAARLVRIGGGPFDDRSTNGQLFWGFAGSRRTERLLRADVGAYYLGIRRDSSVFEQGRGLERRHTVGIKWTGTGARLALNYDGLLQWGTFGDASIRAWAFATETSYLLSTAGWRPRVSVRADVASGDRDPANPRLEAFNPLFPGNSYSGAVGLLGPTNLTDATPAITMRPRRDLTLGFEAPSYWRTSRADGVYATDLRLLVPSGAGSGKYVGTNPGVLAVWQPTPHLQLQGVITRMITGDFLKNTFVSSGFGFYSSSVVYRF